MNSRKNVRRKRSRPWQTGKRLSNRMTKITEKVTRYEIPNLAHRVHRAAASKGLSLTEVADLMNVHPSRISILIHSESITLDAYQRICKALQIDEADLLSAPPRERMSAAEAAKKRRKVRLERFQAFKEEERKTR